MYDHVLVCELVDSNEAMLYIWLEIGEISKPADNDRPPGAVQPQPQSPVTADRAGPPTLTDSLPVYARDHVLIFLKRYETFEWQNYITLDTYLCRFKRASVNSLPYVANALVIRPTHSYASVFRRIT